MSDAMGMQCYGRVAGGHPEGQPLEGQKPRQNWFHVCGILSFVAQMSDHGIDGSGGGLRSAETFAIGLKNTQKKHAPVSLSMSTNYC